MEQKNRTSDFSKQMGKESPKKNQVSERATFPKKIGKKSPKKNRTMNERLFQKIPIFRRKFCGNLRDKAHKLEINRQKIKKIDD